MEDMMLMKRLVIWLRLAIAFGSSDTDLQSLVISSQQSNWDNSHTSCRYLAGEGVFCTEYNTSQKCRPEVADFYDMSGLPETFTAWVDSFLQTSYSITFDGCYEVTRDDSIVSSLIKYKTVADLKECAMSCSNVIVDIGWLDGECLCIIGVAVSPVSTMTALLSPIQCTDEDLNRNNTVINLYKRIKHTNLIYKRCPVGSYLGGYRHVFSDMINCEESLKYYCNNSNNVFGPDTWNEAVDNCSSMSGRLINRREIFKKHSGKPIQYWVNGIIVEKLAFSTRKTQDTLCTALLRDGSGLFRFSLLNCSLELHSLCVEQEKVDLEALSTEETSKEDNTKEPTLNRHSTSSVTAPSETSEEQNPTTPDTKFNESDVVDDDNVSAGGIAIGITVVIVCIVVVIVCYRRKKKQFEGKLKYRKLQAGFKSNKDESDVKLTQNLRYLPSVSTHPSGYSVSNLKIPDTVSVEQVEVNAIIYTENSITGNPKENVGQLKALEEYVNPGDNSESKKEQIEESGIMKNDLMVADEDEENINVESNEEHDNTEIQTEEKGASYEEIDNDIARANIQEMKEENGGNERRVKGNHGEVDICKLRALIADENYEPNMASHIFRNFSMNDRVDSAIFK